MSDAKKTTKETTGPKSLPDHTEYHTAQVEKYKGMQQGASGDNLRIAQDGEGMHTHLLAAHKCGDQGDIDGLHSHRMKALVHCMGIEGACYSSNQRFDHHTHTQELHNSLDTLIEKTHAHEKMTGQAAKPMAKADEGTNRFQAMADSFMRTFRH